MVDRERDWHGRYLPHPLISRQDDHASSARRAAMWARLLLLDQLAGTHRDIHDLCSESTGFYTPVDKSGRRVQDERMPGGRVLEDSQAARERGA